MSCMLETNPGGGGTFSVRMLDWIGRSVIQGDAMASVTVIHHVRSCSLPPRTPAVIRPASLPS